MKVNNFKALNIYQNIETKGKSSNSEEGFLKFLENKVKEVDHSQKEAKAMLESLAKGEDVSLSDVAITLSKAGIEMKLLVRIRNKILEAYQEIMRMQI